MACPPGDTGAPPNYTDCWSARKGGGGLWPKAADLGVPASREATMKWWASRGRRIGTSFGLHIASLRSATTPTLPQAQRKAFAGKRNRRGSVADCWGAYSNRSHFRSSYRNNRWVRGAAAPIKGLERDFIFDHVAWNIDLVCPPGVVASLPQWWRPADS